MIAIPKLPRVLYLENQGYDTLKNKLFIIIIPWKKWTSQFFQAAAG